MFYQLKAIRKNTKPPIWRRIFVPSNITFAQLAVILEAILEYAPSDQFEMEFFTRKERLAQWQEGMKPIHDFYYSFLNAPDTYINEWMESEKAFTFRINGGYEQADLPEYRIEIEKVLDGVTYSDNGIKRKLDHPLIGKQISDINDPFWTDPVTVNEFMKQQYTIREADEEYQYVSEILAQVNSHGGLSVSRKMTNRQIHNELSAGAMLKEMGEQLSKAAEILQKIDEKQKKVQDSALNNVNVQAQPQKKSGSRSRECKLENYLKSYSKEDLQGLAEDLGIALSNKRKDRMAYDLARTLLDGSVMKARLLSLSEQELDIFEKVIEKGPYIPAEEEQTLIDAVYNLDYLCRYSDDTVQVPDEVIALYTAIKGNGYREYHSKASWLLKCITMANYIYLSEPLDVVFQMYRRNKGIKAAYQDFRKVLEMIPESMTESVIVGDMLIERTAYQNGAFKHLEQARRDVDYYIPDKQEIELFQQDCYPSYEMVYQKLLQFFEKDLRYPNDFSKYLCGHVFVVFCGGGLIPDLMKILNNLGVQVNSEAQARRFADLLMEVNNETRMAELNGHKPNEIKRFLPMFPVQDEVPKQAPQPQRAEKKIYPNDPCPCGSGKKYKKCCGR